jgi:cell division septation protein DedD
MSLGAQIAGVAGRVTGAVGGGPILGGLVIAGLVVGGLAGAFAGQPKPAGTSASELDIYPCWKVGTVFAMGPPGQKVWVTGKNADGTWYRVYTGSPTHPEGWVHSALITVLQPGTLQVVDCSPITALAVGGSPFETDTPVQNNSASPEPTPVPTATPRPTPTPTPRPTPTPTPRPTSRPTPRPTPVPTPVDTTAPVADADNPSPSTIYRGTGTCPTTPNTTNITGYASDPQSGIKNVVFKWIDAAGVPHSKAMTSVGGGVYKGTLNANTDLTTIYPNGLEITVVATNKANLTSQAVAGRVLVPC